METTNKEKPEKPAEKKDQSKSNSLPDTEKKSAWQTGLDTIVGDNKLLGAVLKIILSPLAIVVVLCGVGFLIYKNLEYKKEIQKLSDDYKDLKASHEKLQEKYLDTKSHKIPYDGQGGISDNDDLKIHRSNSRNNRKKQQTFYLD